MIIHHVQYMLIRVRSCKDTYDLLASAISKGHVHFKLATLIYPPASPTDTV